MTQNEGTTRSNAKSGKRPLLEMPEKHLGRKAAVITVRRCMDRLGITMPEKDWHKGFVTLQGQNDVPRQISVQQLVEEARDRGSCVSLQHILDRKDPFFGGTFLMATDTHAMNLSMQYAGYSVELKGPCRVAPIEDEITDDILYFRRAACDASSPPTDLAATARYYRSYLQSSVSVVESFINRHVHLLRHFGHTAAEELARIRPFDERLETWVTTVAGKQRDSHKRGLEWSQFCELRQERNRLVHALEPFMGHSVGDMVRGLNYVREGVGGLLMLLRRLANQEPLGFMERLKNAPLVTSRKPQ